MCALIPMSAAPGCKSRNAIVLAEKGSTRYSIVVAANAAEAEKYAAEELAHFLKRITGAAFAVRRDDVPVSDHEIVLGETNRKRLDDLPTDLKPQAWEGFAILPEDDRLHILGNIPRATLYGVYDLLEEDFGVHFLTPEFTHVPQSAVLTLPRQARKYDPPYEYRCMDVLRDPNIWAARNRLNGYEHASIPLGEKLGGVTRLGHPTHTFAYLVPAAEHFESHPDCFVLIDGKRISRTLCLTNPDTLRIATQTARQWAQGSKAGSDTKYIVSITQNDSGAHCQCDDCRAVDAEDGTPFSGSLVRFVNGLARELGPEFPNVQFETFAYQTSELAPTRTRTEPNVNVYVALINKDSGRSLDIPQVHYLSGTTKLTHFGPEHETRFAYDNLRGWTRMSDHVYTWDYNVSFHDYLVPYPNLWSTGENIRIFSETGVIGYRGQNSRAEGGEMKDLRSYFVARQLWRPQCDYRETAEEFCRLYYGEKAGRHVMRYIDLIHDTWPKMKRPLWWGGYKDVDIVRKADRILTKATDAAQTLDQKQRVAIFRMPIWKLMLVLAFGEEGKVVSLPHWSHLPEKDAGDAGSWYEGTDTDTWQRVEIPIRPYGSGKGLGAGLYAATFEMPDTGGAPLALHFAAMDGNYDVALDGVPIAKRMESGLGYYQEVNYLPLNGVLGPGRHTIVVRVRDGLGFYRLRHLENPEFPVADAVTIMDRSRPLPPEIRTAAEGFLAASKAAGLKQVFYGYHAMEPYLGKVLWPKMRFLLEGRD